MQDNSYKFPEPLPSKFNSEMSRSPKYYGTTNFPMPVVVGYGKVNADGTITGNIFQPGVWSVTKTGAGSYTIAHTLQTLMYVVLITPVDTAARIGQVNSQGLTDFQVRTYTTGAVLTDTAFNFYVLTNF